MLIHKCFLNFFFFFFFFKKKKKKKKNIIEIFDLLLKKLLMSFIITLFHLLSFLLIGFKVKQHPAVLV